MSSSTKYRSKKRQLKVLLTPSIATGNSYLLSKKLLIFTFVNKKSAFKISRLNRSTLTKVLYPKDIIISTKKIIFKEGLMHLIQAAPESVAEPSSTNFSPTNICPPNVHNSMISLKDYFAKFVKRCTKKNSLSDTCLSASK